MRRTRRRIMRLLTMLTLIVAGGVLALVFHSMLPAGLTDALELDQNRVERALNNISGETDPIGGAEPSVVEPAIATVSIGWIRPQENQSCVAAACTSNRLRVSAVDPLTFDIDITPQDITINKTYVIVLRAPSGYILDSGEIKWTKKDLERPSGNERSSQTIREAERRRIKSLSLGINPDDVSIRPFVKEYNTAYNAALKIYEEELFKIVDKLPRIFDGIPVPGSVGPEPFTFDPELERIIIDQHYTFDILPASVFIEELAQLRGSG